MNKKVVVAFSGGLDTSYTVMKLRRKVMTFMQLAPTLVDSAQNSWRRTRKTPISSAQYSM